MKYFIGYDLGSSSIKAALLDSATGKPVASSQSPVVEMKIHAPKAGFAEQDPENWWNELILATQKLHHQCAFKKGEIAAIGISYQMHGLVCINHQMESLRPAIIWCDSRAVDIGSKAFDQLGHNYCLEHFLNSPGNFTASKLKWVKDHEPRIYCKIFRVLLPGDYLAMKMTGEAVTTSSGLSEGIFWDYQENGIAQTLLDFYEIDNAILAPVVPVFGEQGKLQKAAAEMLSIAEGTPVCYRAGDQPNNAFSLQVLDPGEIAATAGTSGVVYGVSGKKEFDTLSRVNSFLHVSDTPENPRLGVLMCLNGTGAFNSWLRREFFNQTTYESINAGAEKITAGSDGIFCYPFGNGSERILGNLNPGACIRGVDFNRHGKYHIARAAQEGIVFSLIYGTEIMQEMGLPISRVRAGFANMFLSNVFSQTFANLIGCPVELYDTDGSIGAARGAGHGVGYYKHIRECYTGMKIVQNISPDKAAATKIRDCYQKWKEGLSDILHNR